MLTGLSLAAQSDVSATDSELWVGHTFKLKINKKIRAELEQQTRINDNLGGLKSSFAEFGFRYKLADYLNFKLQYRYTVYDERRNRHRFSLDINLKEKLKKTPLTLKYRLRIQNSTVSYTGQNITFLRNQIGVEYNLSKLVDPFAEYESFYRLNLKNEFRVNRYTLGLEWKVNKKIDLKTLYQVDQEFNVKSPERQNIVGVMFSYDL